jgi:hypothetical protein
MIPCRTETFALPLLPLSSAGSGRRTPQRMPSFYIRRPIASRPAFRLGEICRAHRLTEVTGFLPPIALRAHSIFTASHSSGAADCDRIARRDRENRL